MDWYRIVCLSLIVIMYFILVYLHIRKEDKQWNGYCPKCGAPLKSYEAESSPNNRIYICDKCRYCDIAYPVPSKEKNAKVRQ